MSIGEGSGVQSQQQSWTSSLDFHGHSESSVLLESRQMLVDFINENMIAFTLYGIDHKINLI